jgi:hypothetical protein
MHGSPDDMFVGQDLVVDMDSGVPAAQIQQHMRETLEALRANLDQQHRYTCNFIGCALKKVRHLLHLPWILALLLPFIESFCSLFTRFHCGPTVLVLFTVG